MTPKWRSWCVWAFPMNDAFSILIVYIWKSWFEEYQVYGALMEVLMRLRRCQPRLEIDVAAAAAAAAGWWTQYRECLASQSHGALARTGHQFSFHQDRDTTVWSSSSHMWKQFQKKNSLEIQAKQGLFLGYFRKPNQGQRITYKKVSVKFPYS